jgi:hypothetical protein
MLREQTVLRFFCCASNHSSSHHQEGDSGGGGSGGGCGHQRSSQSVGHHRHHDLFTLHYFTFDDTVEVKASHGMEGGGGGYGSFPFLLKRQRLPKKMKYLVSQDRDGAVTSAAAAAAASASASAVAAAVPGNDHFSSMFGPRDMPLVGWEDLACGGVLSVFGTSLLLLSTDKSTKEWYQARGIVQTPVPLAPETTTTTTMVAATAAAATRTAVTTHNNNNNQNMPHATITTAMTDLLPPSNNGFGENTDDDDIDAYALGLCLNPKDRPRSAVPMSSLQGFDVGFGESEDQVG